MVGQAANLCRNRCLFGCASYLLCLGDIREQKHQTKNMKQLKVKNQRLQRLLDKIHGEGEIAFLLVLMIIALWLHWVYRHMP